MHSACGCASQTAQVHCITYLIELHELFVWIDHTRTATVIDMPNLYDNSSEYREDMTSHRSDNCQTCSEHPLCPLPQSNCLQIQDCVADVPNLMCALQLFCVESHSVQTTASYFENKLLLYQQIWECFRNSVQYQHIAMYVSTNMTLYGCNAE